jgi:hypothetical protein
VVHVNSGPRGLEMCSTSTVIPGVARRARQCQGCKKGAPTSPNFPNNFLSLNNLAALRRDYFMAPAAVTSFCDPWAVHVGMEELFGLCLWSLSTWSASCCVRTCRWFLTLTSCGTVSRVVSNLVAVNARRRLLTLLNFTDDPPSPLERALTHTVEVVIDRPSPKRLAVALFGSASSTLTI